MCTSSQNTLSSLDNTTLKQGQTYIIFRLSINVTPALDIKGVPFHSMTRTFPEQVENQKSKHPSNAVWPVSQPFKRAAE
jgi:hypothetical protein